jgi:hypothetical protein
MEDTYKNIEEFAQEMGIEGLITADGYDEAFVGVADRFGKEPVAVYSYEMCIQILVRDNDMSHEEALEYFEYNTIGNEHLVPKFADRIDNCPQDWLGL